jgi:hypothetical protein
MDKKYWYLIAGFVAGVVIGPRVHIPVLSSAASK